MISADYAEQNRRLHELRPDYGAKGCKWAPLVAQGVRAFGATSFLDYGCGKNSLCEALAGMDLPGLERIVGYDPGRPEFAERPEPADMVACTDVLEHVEPDHVDAVLDDLRALTGKALFLDVACCPAKKFLPDGRNAHLSVHPPEWWLERLIRRFRLLEFRRDPNEGAFVCTLLPSR